MCHTLRRNKLARIGKAFLQRLEEAYKVELAPPRVVQFECSAPTTCTPTALQLMRACTQIPLVSIEAGHTFRLLLAYQERNPAVKDKKEPNGCDKESYHRIGMHGSGAGWIAVLSTNTQPLWRPTVHCAQAATFRLLTFTVKTSGLPLALVTPIASWRRWGTTSAPCHV